jgi:hypothetical protein
MKNINALQCILSCLLVLAAPCRPLAAQEKTTLTWAELVSQAGLVGLEEKKESEFIVDRDNDFGDIMVVRAEIALTDKDWEWLNREDELNLLRPWKRDIVTHEEWKDTVDLIPSGDRWNVSPDNVRLNSPSVVLRKGGSGRMGRLRVYILGSRPSDGRKCLYYFYMSLAREASFKAGTHAPETPLTIDTLTWAQVAAHAGLLGLRDKRKEQFVADRFNDKDGLRSIRAEIVLTDEDSRRLRDNYHLLSPWLCGIIKPEEWRNTVEGGYSGEGRVSAKHLDIRSTASAVLLRQDQKSIRIYLLGKRPSDGKSCLYYFFRKGD